MCILNYWPDSGSVYRCMLLKTTQRCTAKTCKKVCKPLSTCGSHYSIIESFDRSIFSFQPFRPQETFPRTMQRHAEMHLWLAWEDGCPRGHQVRRHTNDNNMYSTLQVQGTVHENVPDVLFHLDLFWLPFLQHFWKPTPPRIAPRERWCSTSYKGSWQRRHLTPPWCVEAWKKRL